MNSNQQEPIFMFTEANVQRLKDKYSKEMKDEADNPIKICMKLIFEAAIEKDTNKRLSLAQELSKFLTKPDGVINLFLALIDFDNSSQKFTTHNQRFIAVANIIACLPKLCMPYEDYCSNIFHQLKPLLISDNPKYCNLAGIITKSLIYSPNSRSKDVAKVIFKPMFEALMLQECPERMKPHEAIAMIHNLILNYVPTTLFVTLFPQLFYCLVVLDTTPSRLRPLLKTVLVSILNGLKPGAACCLIEKTLFYSNQISRLYNCSVQEDGVSIRVVGKEEKELSQEYLDNKKVEEVLILLLEDSDNQLLILEFFFHFKEAMWSAKEEKYRERSASLIDPLLVQTIQEKSTKLDLLSIIATNSGRCLNLISRTLINYVASLRCDERDFSDLQKLINPSIKSCLDILEVLAASIHCDSDRETLNRECLPILKEISLLLKEKDESYESKDLYQDLNSLIQILDKNLGSIEPTSSDSATERMEREFSSVMKDLNDKLVPVRVHALVRLKQLILANDPYIISRIPLLYSKIESSLADEEPYVFLACINLMAEMATRKTNEILPKLIELYLDKELNLQHRINVGEVLVRLTKQMNQTAPLYAQQVISMLLKGCQDDEELMQASSLTNMGEICRQLGDSLGKYILDILSCIETILKSDSVEVKCAAVDLLRTTLYGLDRSRVESIQRELKSIYTLLKRLKSKTLDESLCLQVDLALDEVDRLAHDLLGSSSGQQEGLVKSIKVIQLLDE